MKMTNCPKCGSLFAKFSNLFCPKCEKLEEEQFQKLHLYINEHPLSNVKAVSEATKISAKRIFKYMREGRLQITEGLSGDFCCIQCGAHINIGDFCNSCSAKMLKKLSGAFQTPPPSHEPSSDNTKKGSGMHTRG